MGSMAGTERAFVNGSKNVFSKREGVFLVK